MNSQHSCTRCSLKIETLIYSAVTCQCHFESSDVQNVYLWYVMQACQISILKGCWIHMLLLRSVSLYDVDRDVWVTPRGDIPTEILKNATGYVQLHDDHIRYCHSMKSLIGNDLTIIVILQVSVVDCCIT